jgi:CBS-domain-containing membrane protein
VSEFDLKRYADTLDSTRIESVMTRDPITVMPSETPEHAASLMRRHNVGALPVIHGGKVVGIVTDDCRHKTILCPAPPFPFSSLSTSRLVSAARSHLYASNCLSDGGFKFVGAN